MTYETIPDDAETVDTIAMSRVLLDEFKKIIQMEGIFSPTVLEEIQKGHIPAEKISSIVASSIKLGYEEKLEILETLDIGKRLEILKEKLAKEVNIMQAKEKIQHEVEEKIGKDQKEFILREQLRAIEKEL